MGRKQTADQRQERHQMHIMQLLITDLKKYDKIYKSAGVKYAQENLTAKAHEIMQHYYNDGFVPRVYDRTYNLMRKSTIRPYIEKKPDGTWIGGVYISNEGMYDYYVNTSNLIPEENAKNPRAKVRPSEWIWESMWIEGYHGYNRKEANGYTRVPYHSYTNRTPLQELQDEAISVQVEGEKYAEKHARSKKYRILKFA